MDTIYHFCICDAWPRRHKLKVGAVKKMRTLNLRWNSLMTWRRRAMRDDPRSCDAPQTGRAVEVKLAQGEIWSGNAQKGDVLFCTAGTLWLTREDDASDYILHAGERFVSTRKSLIVAQACTVEERSSVAAFRCLQNT